MFCGNLPYYSGTAQIRVLRSLSMRVKAFGHLIIGRGEKLDNISFGFDPVVNVKGLYCKREDPPEEVYVEPEVKQPTLNTRFGVPRTPAPIAKAR